MKKVLSFISMISMIISSASAQKTPVITGTWEGKLNVGVTLRIVFKFMKDSAGNMTGTSYSPDQGNQPIPCSNISIKNDSLLLDIEIVHASYAGKFQNDSLIKGQFTQGRGFDLALSKVLKVTELARPQTPKPPFDYISKDVEYDNADKLLHYGATITFPKGNGPFPAILLITGSGAQNRDEEIFGHKPFAVIADYLTKQGYVVMRVDDRGIDKSTGDFKTATTADFAKDVNTSLDYLKKLKQVDPKHLGMLGHSEGGMIAPIVASQRNDINFIVLLAAPGEKIATLMKQQNIAVLKSSGFTQEAADDYGNLYEKMINAIVSSRDSGEAKNKINDAVNKWKENTPKAIVAGTTGITNDTAQSKFVTAISEAMSTPWFKYFLQFDPTPYLEKLNCKVLALNGSKDLQVSPESNLLGIKEAIGKSKSPVYEVKKIAGLNHLFQDCKSCTINEYGQLEETFSPEALAIIGDWLDKNVK